MQSYAGYAATVYPPSSSRALAPATEHLAQKAPGVATGYKMAGYHLHVVESVQLQMPSEVRVWITDLIVRPSGCNKTWKSEAPCHLREVRAAACQMGRLKLQQRPKLWHLLVLAVLFLLVIFLVLPPFQQGEGQFCSVWDNPGMSHSEWSTNGEEWCVAFAAFSGLTAISHTAGQAMSCPMFLDVRFVDGSVSTGHQLHFTHSSGRWLGNLTKRTSYFMIRRHTAHCSHIKGVVFHKAPDSDSMFHKGPVHTISHQSERVQITGHIRPHSTPLGEYVNVFTQLDADRLPRLEALARSVDLMIVAAVYYDGSTQGHATIQKLCQQSKVLSSRVHVVLVAPTALGRPEKNSWLSHW